MSNIGVNLRNVQSKVYLNDKPLNNINVKELKNDISLEKAEKELKSSFGDGYDTIGFKLNDKNYIAYGKGLSAKPGDKINIGGKETKVSFFEDEDNSMKEGIKSLSPTGVASAIGVSGLVIGLSAGGYAGGAEAISAGFGKEIFKISSKWALIGSAAVATTVLVASSLSSKLAETNDTKIKELTK